MPELLTHTATLTVPGMHCGGCVGRVEKAALAVPGVQDVAANLANRRVTLTLDAPEALQDAVTALETAGYAPETVTGVLDIEGMHCASCVGRVEAALAAQPGVREVSVNLASQSARLRYVEGQVTLPALAEALGAVTSYTATPRSSETVDPGVRQAAEAAALKRQLILAAALTAPVFVIEMGGHLVPVLHHFVAQTIGMQASWVLQFVLTTLVLAGPGAQFYRLGLPSLARGAPDMNALVALGTGAAYIYSTLVTWAPALLPASARHVYFEAAAVIVVLILLGRYLEARARGRTGAAISKLLSLQPKTARVLRDGATVEVPIAELLVGDVIQVRPGERVAADGEVLEGQSFVDEAAMSGEPVPLAKGPGDYILGGTVNGNGVFSFRATAVGADTTLAQIVRMVEDAQAAKLPIQGLVDRITLWFVPVVLAAAVVTVLVWLAFGPDLTFALVAGVSVLIIACPCAMGLATPTSIMVGTGRGAELGVLFRKGDALQRLQEARVIALDKTGTLTEGRPEVTDLLLGEGFGEDEALAAVAAVEALSEHPLASAVARFVEARGLEVPVAEGFEARPGFGASATVDGSEVLVGSARLMSDAGVDLGGLGAQIEALAAAGKTVVYGAIGRRLALVFGIADPVKASTPQALAALRAQGLEVVMITGDGRATAEAVAAELGITQVVAEVLPAGKVDALRALKARGPVAFVGDGINDAPALAEADVGIAIGTGTDIAVEAADVVLVSGALTGVVDAHRVSRATLRNIRQNLGWAFGYNVLLIPVAAGILYPAFGLLLSPMLAAGAMALSSVAVVSNALRLRWVAPAGAAGRGAGKQAFAGDLARAR